MVTPLFSVFKSTASSNVTGDSTLVLCDFDQVIIDSSSGYNTSTYSYTIPQDGTYLFCTTGQIYGLLSSHTAMNVYLNTVTVTYPLFYNNAYNNSSSGLLNYTASQILNLSQGTTINVLLGVNNGTKVVSIGGVGSPSPSPTTFSGFLIG